MRTKNISSWCWTLRLVTEWRYSVSGLYHWPHQHLRVWAGTGGLHWEKTRLDDISGDIGALGARLLWEVPVLPLHRMSVGDGAAYTGSVPLRRSRFRRWRCLCIYQIRRKRRKPKHKHSWSIGLWCFNNKDWRDVKQLPSTIRQTDQHPNCLYTISLNQNNFEAYF